MHTHKASVHAHAHVAHMSRNTYTDVCTLSADIHAFLHNHTHAYIGVHERTQAHTCTNISILACVLPHTFTYTHLHLHRHLGFQAVLLS